MKLEKKNTYLDTFKLIFVDDAKDYFKENYKVLMLFSMSWCAGFFITGKVISGFFFGMGISLLIEIGIILMLRRLRKK